MTAYYVRSGAAGAGTGADWANAYTTLTAAFSGHAAGDIYYVSEDHAESTAGAVTLASNGTLAVPTFVYCVNHLGTVPPVSADRRTTATVTTTGTGTISLGGTGTIYDGIIFSAGTGATNSSIFLPSVSSASIRLVNCSLRLACTNAASTIAIGASATGVGGFVDLENTTVQFGATGQSISASAMLRWRNTASAILGATIPTTLFTFLSNRPARIDCNGVDLSAAGSGKTIVGNTAGSASIITEFTDCKIDAAVTFAAVPPYHGALLIDAVRAGASGVNYNVYRGRYTGSLVEELTIIRTGGASDGTTGLSWKIVTTANSTWTFPFESPPIAIWNDTTGSSVTATLQCIWGGGAVPNDDEIWLDVEYLGSGSTPQGSFVHDSKADPLAAAAGQTAGSGTWGGSTTKFELSKAFTPQQKGWLLVRVKAAKASSTFYIDPKVTLT